MDRLRVVRVDLDRPIPSPPDFGVQSNAARLPFADGVFAAVIANHSVEHFTEVDAALAEAGRVLRPEGALYISVPDATTLTDRLYRWLGRGGGHVNAFTSTNQVAALVKLRTGRGLVATKLLYSSFSYLNRHNQPAKQQRKMWLFMRGNEACLRSAVGLIRLVDGIFGTRLGIYGWAFYFGTVHAEIDRRAWRNVCIRCGAAASADRIRNEKRVVRVLTRECFRCPDCDALSPFSDDSSPR